MAKDLEIKAKLEEEKKAKEEAEAAETKVTFNDGFRTCASIDLASTMQLYTCAIIFVAFCSAQCDSPLPSNEQVARLPIEIEAGVFEDPDTKMYTINITKKNKEGRKAMKGQVRMCV